MKNNLLLALTAALKAGQEILKVYEGEFEVETKTDNSPLTLADKLAHNEIKNELSVTGLHFLSEEGKTIPYSDRKEWQTFWLVDPLDGTKEFIKRNGEFTVNIALIKNNSPVLGVVYVPVKNTLYFGDQENGSFIASVSAKDFSPSAVENIIHNAQKLPLAHISSHYTIVASRSHNTPETEMFIEQKKQQYGNVKLISSGSSIKLCLVAEGKANIYPRLAPTMEWDTAAGHAVAKFAGCKVYNYNSKEELIYNKENLLNPWFVVERIS